MRLAILVFGAASALDACGLVEGDRIVGRELASQHAAFGGIDPDSDLGPAPVAGSRRVFRYFELERIAREHSLLLPENVPREVCFERATVRLSREVLREALSTPEVEIVDFSRNALPSGKAEFLASGLSTSGLWRGRWLFGENRSIPIWVRVRVPGSGGASGRPSTQPLAPEIERGDAVRVEVRSGGVVLAFEAAAESSGHLGEHVTVRNPANGQRFRAVVEAHGKVGIRK